MSLFGHKNKFLDSVLIYRAITNHRLLLRCLKIESYVFLSFLIYFLFGKKL